MSTLRRYSEFHREFLHPVGSGKMKFDMVQHVLLWTSMVYAVPANFNGFNGNLLGG